MALIRIFSDLHLEFGIDVIKKCVDISSANKMKYTVLAGDITNYKKKEKILTKLITELKEHTKHIIYVLGNHEYYEPQNKSINEIKNEYKFLCTNLGINLLDNSSLETDDFVFYGTTMWSNVNAEAFYRMNDQYSFKNRQDVIDIHEESVDLLDKFVTEYRNVKPLVIITHHLPSFKLIDEQYKIYGELNTGFASKLDHIIRNPINYWIYGHTHKPNNTIINGVKLICNPLGYPGHERINFKDCVIY
jgi:predicted phosphodiesterase